MKFIAAHKVMLMVGLVLAGGVAWYLHRRGSSSQQASGSLSPDYGGVATSPYSDSAAPQFSFDLGSLLGNQTTPPSGSSSAPPAKTPSGGLVPGPVPEQPPGPSGVMTPGGQQGADPGPVHFPPVTLEPIHAFGPGGAVTGFGGGSPTPAVSLPEVNPFSSTSTIPTTPVDYVPASSQVPGGHFGPPKPVAI